MKHFRALLLSYDPVENGATGNRTRNLVLSKQCSSLFIRRVITSIEPTALEPGM